MSSALKDALDLPVNLAFEAADGECYQLTRLHLVGRQWRRLAVEILREIDPEAHAAYSKAKYSQGDNPTLEQRREAYRLVVNRFLDLTYTVPGV